MHQRSVPYENRFGLDEPGKTTKQSAPLGVHKWTQRPYTVMGVEYCPTVVPVGTTYEGVASWYGPDFHGNKTSSGEVYDMYSFSAAHKTLPMNTMIRVTNCYNNKSIVVRVNDRGPFVKKRIVDLSYRAGKEIGLDRTGIAPVTLEVLEYDRYIAGLLGKEEAKPVQNTVAVTASAAKDEQKHDAVKASEPSESVKVKKVDLDPVKTAEAEPVVKKPQPEKVPDQKPEVKKTAAKADEPRGYVVQIGSFSKLEGAKKIKEGAAFVYSGRDVKIVSMLKKEIPVYKVYVSGFDTRDEARAFVQKNNINGAFIALDD